MFESLFTDMDTNGLLDDILRLQSEMAQMFSPVSGQNGIRAARRGTFPPMNIGASAERVDVYLFAAHLDPKSLDVSVQQNLLTISGQRKVEVDEMAEYYRRERFDGEFRRAVTLPEDIDPERIEARYGDGVLHITIQRREAARPRQITVN